MPLILEDVAEKINLYRIIEFYMKSSNRIVAIMLALALSSVSYAQDHSMNHLYMSIGYCFGGAPNTNMTSKDFAYRSFDYSFGVRLNEQVAIFVPITMDIDMMNMTTTKNYNETGTLGLAVSYTFNLGKGSFLEPVLSCGSTVYESDFSYLTPKFEVHWGANMYGFGLFIGLGMQYLHPYGNSTVPDMTMMYAKIGVRLF